MKKQKRNIEIILNENNLDFTITSENVFDDLASIIANVVEKVCNDKGVKKSSAYKRVLKVIENYAKEKEYL